MRRLFGLIMILLVAGALALPFHGPSGAAFLQKGGKGGPGKATPPQRIRVVKDFKVELLYTVPRGQGSWVNLCVDPKGRLITSDERGAGLFRVTPPAVGGKTADTKVEKLPVDIGAAQGLLWAFDSLYVMVNGGGRGKGGRPNGLYRVRPEKPGGELAKVELLRRLEGGGEHGPHAIVLGPDGKSLFCVCGNDTRLTRLSGSYLPKHWGNDNLFPMLARFSGVVPPTGCIYKVGPDGKNWELWSAGYRNHFDAAFNRHGDLFTFDSDMEWDMNTPWYRPTRICLATSGSDFGFRNGDFVFPPRYPDNLPAIYDIGPGSPTGMCFGYGARFPAKYQEALYICDWSYGRLFAVHLTPEGSAYKAQVEEFATGVPLALTDVVVNAKDGALYFLVGGRSTQSALYRITYTGKAPTAPSKGDNGGAEARALRRKLESFHKPSPAAVKTVWPHLGHEDRYIRYAARVALEHQDVEEWRERALKEKEPAAAINALLALARCGKGVKAPILTALDALDWAKLSDAQRSDLLRVYTVLFARLGRPDEAARKRFLARFGPLFPTRRYEVNADLCQLLVYLEAPGIAEKVLKLMAEAPTQEEQTDYARWLRNLKSGWSMAQRRAYFEWFAKAGNYRGGQRFQQYLREIRQTAVDNLSAKEKVELKEVLQRKSAPPSVVYKPRPLVKQWKLEELAPLVEKGLTKRDFERGRRLFGEAKCFGCHRFNNEGGALAPDLTAVSARYSVRDLLDKVLNPSKAISDQYAQTIFTLKDGKVVVGRIVNIHGDRWSVQTDMLSPARLTNVSGRNVESMELSKVSAMPTGLLDTFRREEVLDLMAYILSRGNRRHEAFKK